MAEFNPRRAHREPPDIPTLGLEELRMLWNQMNVTQRIRDENNGFFVVMRQLSSQNALDNPHSLEMTEYVVMIVAKALNETSPPDKCVKILHEVRRPAFLRNLVTWYIVNLTRRKTDRSERVILSTLDIFQYLLDATPTSFEEVDPVFRSVKEVCNNQRFVSSEIRTALQKTERKLEEARQWYTPRGNDQFDHNDDQHEPLQPPNDFRQLPVIPTADEIFTDDRPFLRANKVMGSYTDLEEYLDIHFRLLREDFVRPLRQAIKSIAEDGIGRLTEQDVRVYPRATILYPKCDNTGLSYTVKFDLGNKRIHWKASRRLQYGNLVCLSNDNFQTRLFATVSNRELKGLQNGLIDVQFIGDDVDVRTNRPFVMIETKAYFEAYRHVLAGLQIIRTLPFTDTLVHVSRHTESPRYLQGPRCLYDLGVLCHNEDRGKYDEIDIKNKDEWPSAETLGLDDTQYEALMFALRHEVAVIQGPPGTGKTFIGLKIIQILLHNKPLWAKDTPQCPILVIAYTNHALDQFLEGLLDMGEHNIVRVGGRSKSDKLNDHFLRNIRKNMRINKEFRHDVAKRRTTIWNTMESLERDIQLISTRVESTMKGVLHERALQDFIKPEHFTALTGMFGADDNDGNQACVLHFLGLEQYCHFEAPNPVAGNDDDPLENEPYLSGDEASESDDSDEDDVQELRRLQEIADDVGVTRRRTRNSTEANTDIALTVEDIRDTSVADNVWRTQRRRVKYNGKSVKEIVRDHLQRLDHLTDEEVDRVHNMWALPIGQRWRLYRNWVSKYRQSRMRNLGNKDRQYSEQAQRLRQVADEEDAIVMRNANVIGMTTTGAAKYKRVLQRDIRSKIVIMEEAAEVLEAHVVTSLSEACQHLIMIGDHEQLRPKTNVYELGKDYHLSISLFERLMRNQVRHVTLGYQHRMRPEISSLLRHIYPNLLDHEVVKSYPNVRGIRTNLFFVNHNNREDDFEELHSKVNRYEADYIVELCRYLILQGYNQKQITILSPYAGQLFDIKDAMKDSHVTNRRKEFFREVRVTSVDNFQGEENDIILASLVRCNEDDKLGFMKESNRICVTLSRAKHGLFVIGNFDFFCQNNDLWKIIVSEIKRNHRECFGNLLLQCQKHTGQQGILVGHWRDFRNAPEGGCNLHCGDRLPCGHTCRMICHPIDPEHKEYKCRQKCEKSPCGAPDHECFRECFEDCADCTTLVPKTLACGHTQNVPCHEMVEDVRCIHPCTIRLGCGHMCLEGCGQPHSTPRTCTVPVNKTWPSCGHSSSVPCNTDVQTTLCPVKCEEELWCGHPCSGTCGECFQGRLHRSCDQPCDRILVCGHKCESMCPASCPPCKLACENQCVHSRCPKQCGVACQPCKEPCFWRCEHYQCSELCFAPCDRPRCNAPCKMVLKCGHPCIGICGEECPTKCRICNTDEVQEVFLGSEDDPDAIYVQLQDCGHTFEVTDLDRWIREYVPVENGICMKDCPRCKTSIRKTCRYNTEINRILQDIEEVKSKLFGSVEQLEDRRRDVIVLCIMRLQQNEQMKTKDEEYEAFVRKMSSMIDPGSKPLSNNNMICIENLLNIMKEVHVMTSTAKEQLPIQLAITAVSPDVSRIQRFVHGDLRKLYHWVEEKAHPSNLRVSDQEFEEAKAETERLMLSLRIMIAKQRVEDRNVTLPERSTTFIDEGICIYESGLALSDDQCRVIRDELNKLDELLPDSGLKISERERLDILRAMGLSKGHWYKCPNGHVYAIGDCGGANERSKCPVCRLDIGGLNHNLVQGNALATEMDGAQYPAWSNEANVAMLADAQ